MNPQAIGLIASGIVAMIVAALADDEDTVTILPGKLEEAKPGELKIMQAQSLKKGPLPTQALAAYATSKYTKTGPNNIHNGDAWFRWAVYSEKWHRKMDRIVFYAKPQGANKVKSNSDWFNLAWMARCPDHIYPEYKLRRGKVKWSKLKTLIGPKADWQTLTGGVKDVLSEIPDIVASAGLIAGAVGSGGQSAQADTKGQIDQVMSTVKDLLGSASGVIGKTKERTEAAAAIVEAIGRQYQRELLAANPWILRNGKVDLGKNYPQNPRTYEDLFRKPNPGEKRGRPLLYNPRK